MAKRSENQSRFNLETPAKPQGPVECLGMTFENDEARREHFLRLLREGLEELHAKLGGVAFTTVEDAVERMRSVEKWPMGDDARLRELAERMRHADSSKDLLQRWKDEVGFPHGSIEDILSLSDPPYYTACPNPFIADFLKHYGKPYDPNVPYSKEPFAADVSEGKNDPIYNAHSYHTKVPHKAIMRYILHYTEPGDVVFDGFCGTGMTGVAALSCDDKSVIESLGFKVSQDGKTILDANGEPFSTVGRRYALLSDLSPIATFIAYNLNYPLSPYEFDASYQALLNSLEDLESRLYPSFDDMGGINGKINYVVWSDVYVCTECSEEYVYWEAAVDLDKGVARKQFTCPACGASQSTRSLQRAYSTRVDPLLGTPIRLFKQVPVRVSYLTRDNKKRQRDWNRYDSSFLSDLELSHLSKSVFPVAPLPKGDRWKRDAFADKGVTHIHHFYTHRTIEALSSIWDAIINGGFPYRSRIALSFLYTSFADRNATKRNRFVINKYNPRGRVNGPMANSLYLPNLFCEMNILRLMEDKSRDIRSALSAGPANTSEVLISTGSSALLSNVPSDSVDYIFTDPPFGHNIQYSELNLTLESFLGVQTAGAADTVVNEVMGKTMPVYADMMTRIFQEFYRILKPGRWMTVEFHNSKAAVWSAIQEALGRAGFVIAHIATLDKKQRTVHQDTNVSGTVNQDLVISAYKPNGGLEERFKLTAGTEEGVWDFVRTHLKQLPVFVSKDGKAEVIAERQNYLLFDRMVAFHVQRGVTVPLSAAELYAGLAQRFPERDGMYFLPEQVAEYDKKRMKVKEVLQLQLFVTDEASAIQWLKQQLTRKPQTFQELHPQFLKEIGGWQKHEKPLELSELLEQNFLRYDGKGPIPAQLVSWMKQSADLRKIIQEELASGRSTEENGQLETRNQELITRAKARWYVPDPNKAGDLEKLRERALLREFEEYRESKQKRLKVFRLEAIRAGFKKAWQERDYATIIAVARKIPEHVLQEDAKLLMWYDQALTRMGDE